MQYRNNQQTKLIDQPKKLVGMLIFRRENVLMLNNDFGQRLGNIGDIEENVFGNDALVRTGISDDQLPGAEFIHPIQCRTYRIIRFQDGDHWIYEIGC